ncbi:MAG TPA: DUF4230 domain-containing protein [Coriobacteriia bacterium]
MVLVLIVAVSFLGGSSSKKDEPASSSPTITEVQELGELVALRVSVADVMEDTGYDYKGVWIVRGDAEIAVDLEKAQLRSAEEKTKTLILELPLPRVIKATVNHEKSKVYDITKTTWIPFVGDRDELTNQGWTKAQRVVEKACSGAEYIDQAKDQTELVLAKIYRRVGWDVHVVWQD